MSLEASGIEAAIGGPATVTDRRASAERRGKDRRREGSRINKAAPRRSLIQTIALSAAGISGTLAGLMVAVGMIMEDLAWANIFAAVAVAAFSLLAFILGCIEQRLVEIRLELMMANGGARQADRRLGDRRG
jgi:hypothetical protein